VCKSVARAFSAVGRPSAAPQRSPLDRRLRDRRRHGNPRDSFFRPCQTTAVRAPRRTPLVRLRRVPTLKTEGFSPRLAVQITGNSRRIFFAARTPLVVCGSSSCIRFLSKALRFPPYRFLACGRSPVISPPFAPGRFRRVAAISPVLPLRPQESLLDLAHFPLQRLKSLRTRSIAGGISAIQRQSFLVILLSLNGPERRGFLAALVLRGLFGGFLGRAPYGAAGISRGVTSGVSRRRSLAGQKKKSMSRKLLRSLISSA